MPPSKMTTRELMAWRESRIDLAMLPNLDKALSRIAEGPDYARGLTKTCAARDGTSFPQRFPRTFTKSMYGPGGATLPDGGALTTTRWRERRTIGSCTLRW